MKRGNIEVVLGFLDAIRRRDREAAAEWLDPEIVWQGLAPDLRCDGPAQVLDVFRGQREEELEVERLEVIGAERGAVFVFDRPESWELAGIEIHGGLYHALAIEEGRITRIEDHAERPAALGALS